ncbi:hypothetical protein [Bradyrhizobium sp. F1.4.3]|uniref:hypothetical protein n=1 Tax=Bradyrhizobium sp. F1.4.3 TaxID=3156356 RepID=UPI00339813BE
MRHGPFAWIAGDRQIDRLVSPGRRGGERNARYSDGPEHGTAGQGLKSCIVAMWHQKLLLKRGVRRRQVGSSEDQIREGVFDLLPGLRLVVARQMPVRESKVFLQVNGIPVARNMRRAAGMCE